MISKKYCMSCMKPIPLLASKCPHCLSKPQNPWGRIFLIISFLVGVALFL